MNTKWEPVKMCALWVDQDDFEIPSGYQPVCFVGLASLKADANLVVCAPLEFLEKADALSVMNLASDTIKRELRDMVRSGELSWKKR